MDWKGGEDNIGKLREYAFEIEKLADSSLPDERNPYLHSNALQLSGILKFLSGELSKDEQQSLMQTVLEMPVINLETFEKAISDLQNYSRSHIVNMYTDFKARGLRELVIQQRPGRRSCHFSWNQKFISNDDICRVWIWSNDERRARCVTFPGNKTTFELECIPKFQYQVCLFVYDARGHRKAYGSVVYTDETIFSKVELEAFEELAAGYIGEHWQPLEFLSRVQQEKYFREIENSGGIMRAHKKDDNGHPTSPINGVLKGVFFTARPSTFLPKQSGFGDRLFVIPAMELLDPEMFNYYFADVYCCRRHLSDHWEQHHTVTIVIAPKDSDDDFFCSERLPGLDPENNSFIRVKNGEIQVNYSLFCYIELFVAKDVPLNKRPLEHVIYRDQKRKKNYWLKEDCGECFRRLPQGLAVNMKRLELLDEQWQKMDGFLKSVCKQNPKVMTDPHSILDAHDIFIGLLNAVVALGAKIVELQPWSTKKHPYKGPYVLEIPITWNAFCSAVDQIDDFKMQIVVLAEMFLFNFGAH